jgi:hypothetical protein
MFPLSSRSDGGDAAVSPPLSQAVGYVVVVVVGLIIAFSMLHFRGDLVPELSSDYHNSHDVRNHHSQKDRWRR